MTSIPRKDGIWLAIRAANYFVAHTPQRPHHVFMSAHNLDKFLQTLLKLYPFQKFKAQSQKVILDLKYRELNHRTNFVSVSVLKVSFYEKWDIIDLVFVPWRETQIPPSVADLPAEFSGLLHAWELFLTAALLNCRPHGLAPRAQPQLFSWCKRQEGDAILTPSDMWHFQTAPEPRKFIHLSQSFHAPPEKALVYFADVRIAGDTLWIGCCRLDVSAKLVPRMDRDDRSRSCKSWVPDNKE